MSKSKDKKKSFVPVFMFIGMGIGFLMMDKLGGVGFVSLMFIGMGIGFLFDTFITIEEKEIKFKAPIKIGGLINMLLGLTFIIGGAAAIVIPEFLIRNMNLFLGLGFIAIGLFIFIYGYSIFKK